MWPVKLTTDILYMVSEVGWVTSVNSLPHPLTSRLQMNGPIGSTTLSRSFNCPEVLVQASQEQPTRTEVMVWLSALSLPQSHYQVSTVTTRQNTRLGSHLTPTRSWMIDLASYTPSLLCGSKCQLVQFKEDRAIFHNTWIRLNSDNPRNGAYTPLPHAHKQEHTSVDPLDSRTGKIWHTGSLTDCY